MSTVLFITIGWGLVAFGVALGWCLRVGFERSRANDDPQPLPADDWWEHPRWKPEHEPDYPKLRVLH